MARRRRVPSRDGRGGRRAVRVRRDGPDSSAARACHAGRLRAAQRFRVRRPGVPVRRAQYRRRRPHGCRRPRRDHIRGRHGRWSRARSRARYRAGAPQGGPARPRSRQRRPSLVADRAGGLGGGALRGERPVAGGGGAPKPGGGASAEKTKPEAGSGGTKSGDAPSPRAVETRLTEQKKSTETTTTDGAKRSGDGVARATSAAAERSESKDKDKKDKNKGRDSHPEGNAYAYANGHND